MEDNTIPEALTKLQRQIDEIKAVIQILDQRIDELVEQLAITTNRATLTHLQDYLDQVRVLQGELLDQPNNLDNAVRVANEAGVVADKFLRNDYDIWRWADVVLDWKEEDGVRSLEPTVALGQFKNVPTLPVYMMALLTWLGAREIVVKGGQRSRLIGDAERLQKHLAAVSIRNEFDKYYMDQPDVAWDDLYGGPSLDC